MVELNVDRRRPEALLDLTRVPELRAWDTDGSVLRLGAGVPYRQIIDQLADRAPGLAIAAPTVRPAHRARAVRLAADPHPRPRGRHPRSRVPRRRRAPAAARRGGERRDRVGA